MKQYDRSVLLRAEKVRLFYKGMGPGALAALLLAWAIVETAGGFGHDLALIWVGALGLVSVAQLILWMLWRKADPNPPASWGWRFFPLPLSLFAGLCWGAAAIYPYPDYADGSDLVLILIVACGVQLMFLLQTALISALVSFVLGLIAPIALVLTTSSPELPPPDQVLVIGAAAVLISLTTLAFARLINLMINQRAGREDLELIMLDSEEYAEEYAEEPASEGDLEQRPQPPPEEQELRRRDLERELFLEKEAAESIAIAKSEFLATMSHEIRTPLNGIVPVLEMLKDTPLDDAQQVLG